MNEHTIIRMVPSGIGLIVPGLRRPIPSASYANVFYFHHHYHPQTVKDGRIVMT